MNNNKLLNILLIIIILLLIAFGIYYFVNDSKDNNEQNETEKTAFETKIEEKQKKLPIAIANLNTDENLETQMPLIIDKIEIKTNGDVYLTVNKSIVNQYDANYKLMSDVVDVEVKEYGNGGYRAIVFLKSDGTVSLITPTKLINNGIINLENNVGNLKNIVDLDSYKAIDVDGKEHILTTYFLGQ